MSRVISVTNQKGGVGKTTTAINLAAALAEAEQKVLLIDFDPQGNTTSGLSSFEINNDKTIYDLICDAAKPEECISKDITEGLDLITADMDLSGVEVEFQSLDDKNLILRDSISKIRENYDYVIIDCPPSLSILTLNALAASDRVIIPVQCEYYALEGLNQVLKTIYVIKQKINKDLTVGGILFTMYDSRTNLSQQVVESVRENLNERIFETMIPRNVRLAEAPSYGQPITMYDSSSRGAESYRLLAAEIINEEI